MLMIQETLLVAPYFICSVYKRLMACVSIYLDESVEYITQWSITLSSTATTLTKQANKIVHKNVVQFLTLTPKDTSMDVTTILIVILVHIINTFNVLSRL